MIDQQDEFIRNNHWFDQLLKERIIFFNLSTHGKGATS